MDSSTGEDAIKQSEVFQHIRPGRLGYGYWLQPIIDANNVDHSIKEPPGTSADALPPQRRGRGRPRVTKARDGSAIEKRRAQVREAQRTYQKRKETVAACEKHRCAELFRVLSDLSTDVEALLQAASKAGSLGQDDQLSRRIQSLWQTYDAAIHSACLMPELRLLQLENDRRIAEHRNHDSFRVELLPRDPQLRPGSLQNARHEDEPSVDLELVRCDDTTLIQPFRSIATMDKTMAGRSIFDIVTERQAAFNSARSSQSPSS